MKFAFYTNLNYNSSASNYGDISKQKAWTLSAPPSSITKFSKSQVEIGFKRLSVSQIFTARFTDSLKIMHMLT